MDAPHASHAPYTTHPSTTASATPCTFTTTYMDAIYSSGADATISKPTCPCLIPTCNTTPASTYLASTDPATKTSSPGHSCRHRTGGRGYPHHPGRFFWTGPADQYNQHTRTTFTSTTHVHSGLCTKTPQH